MSMVIVFGGQSPEHEVSLTSFKGIFPALPKDWNLYPVFISKSGNWFWQPKGDDVLRDTLVEKNACCLAKGSTGQVQLMNLETLKPITPVDFVFVMLHGVNGEDGRLQGYLEMLQVPYSGCGPEASAVCMNKALTKRLCQMTDIPVVPWINVHLKNRKKLDVDKVQLKQPWIVKPARTGSSVGVSKVEFKSDLEGALDHAFAYDSLVLIEEFVQGREIECGVLEDPDTGELVASVPSEIIPGDIFYTYDDKYLNSKAKLICPATLDPIQVRRFKSMALEAFTAVGGGGFARIDFLMRRNVEIFLSEINTIPGFTPISMYPRMFAEEGMNMQSLLSKIIASGLQRFNPSSGSPPRS